MQFLSQFRGTNAVDSYYRYSLRGVARVVKRNPSKGEVEEVVLPNTTFRAAAQEGYYVRRIKNEEKTKLDENNARRPVRYETVSSGLIA